MVSPVVINKLRRVVFSKKEPDSTVVLWGKPEGNSYAFFAYTNGSWQPLQTSGGGGGESYAPVLIKIGEEVYAAVDGTIELPEYPTSLPASDVKPWAKANSKPSYDYSEINNTPGSLPASDVPEWAKAESKPQYNYSEIQNTPSSLPASDVPSWAKQPNKPSYNYSEINNTPTIPDVSSFITKSVNDLANYYLKSETYTKGEVEGLIAAISQFHYEIAESTSAVTNPANNVLYLIGPTGSGSDKYEEYVYPNSTAGWTKIGDTSIDLSGYVTTGALNTALNAYTTTTDLNTLLGDKVDKVSGKGLSTEDYTTAEKNKLGGIAEGAEVNKIDKIKIGNTEQTINNKVVELPAYPTTLPASDVPNWAKQQNKPSYDYSEISNTPSSLPASDVPSWAKQSDPPSTDLDVSTTSGTVTTLTCVVGKYHKITSTVNTLAVTLPSISGDKTKSILLRFTTGSTPNITFTANDSKTIKYYNGYNIEANCEYEFNILYDGSGWVIAVSEIGGQSTSPEVDVETFSGASLTAALNKYYDASADVGTLAVTLPAVGGSKTKSIMMHFTTTSSPNITFTSADNKTISYYSTYAIEASKEYEISIVFNGTKWIIASAEIATS